MQFGICHLSIVPLRSEASDKSELVSQVLYGEHFKVLEQRKNWSKIRLAFDRYEGWIDNKQFLLISEEQYKNLEQQELELSGDLVEFVTKDDTQELLTIPLGSSISGNAILDFSYDGQIMGGIRPKDKIIETAYMYMNSPYMWGGKTPFGIDCSGFTQMVYKLNGYKLFRDASQQAKQGEALSFIEESEAGDLAFFDNDEGNIVHVGIMMSDNYIIHAHGKVRIDRIDHSGIFNVDTKKHSHKLRVIKKVI
ncbi:Cell wall-associated hydrolase, NlpC family [Zhouia amylolytica]|uniref:Lipoprotein n=2 Tax=Zhouia amylolytica TaxID=376730 RepID=W2USC0_9FLAO|nr:C40 family peptidase [Zhouia amylolytica]ETN96366.1 lipoprotein [Zhouia amylolytica AD3]MCQ0112685.1 C40 family peptidase [Zhouia amylolytica]SFS83381.1 Cell wall-associated hydrolase, NlpC family [Zhouia amylolytica]